MAYSLVSRSGLCTLGLLTLSLSACSDGRTPVNGDMAGGDNTDMAPAGPKQCAPEGLTNKISNLTGQHASPRVTTNGLGYTVAWLTGIPGTPATYRVDAAITDQTGKRLGPNIPMSEQNVADADPPSVAPVNGGTAIAWTRKAGAATDIVLTVIDATGQKLDATGMPCEPSDTNCGLLPLTHSGLAHTPFLERPYGDQHESGPTQNQLGLAFVDSRNHCSSQPCTDGNDVFWKRVQTNGAELLFEKALTTSPNAKYASPRLAFDGVHQAAVWRDVTSGSNTDLYFTTIDNLGQVTSTPKKIGSASGANAPSTPDILWSGSEYALVSATGTDATAAVLFQRQSSTGTSTLPPTGITFGGSACAPAIAFDGEAYGVVYQTDCNQAGSDLAFVRINADGTRYALDGTSCGSSVDPKCGELTFSHNELEVASRPEIVLGTDGSFAVVWMQGKEGANLDPQAPLEVYLQRIRCQ
jgi:hypothetical protein